MEVVDLCDSEDELPPPLVARLQQRETTGVGKQAHTKQQSAALAPQAASGRPPLLAVLQNQAAPSSQPSTGSMHWEASRSQPSYADGGGNLLAGAEALRRRQQARAARKAAKDAAAAVAIQEDASMGSWQASSPQPQCRQPEQGAQQDGPGCGASPAAGHRDSPTGGQATSQVEPAQQQQQQQEPWELPSWQEQGLDDAGGDADWRPPGGSQRARRRSSAGAVAPLGPDRGQQQPAAKKPRQPKRTKQEQEQAQALKVQQREDRKRLKQAVTAKWALQQVRLLVDAALMSSSGGGGSLGVSMLGHLDEHNRSTGAAAEKVVNYQVCPLDMAPFRVLRWQHRRLADAAAAPASQQLLASQVSGMPCSQLEEQWEQAPHIMVCMQPQEFVDAVLHDRLASLLSLLESRAPGHRPYLLVCGLAHHTLKHDRRQHDACMRGGGAAVGGAAGAGVGAGAQRAVRAVVEEFVTELAVRCPRLGFRDVVDAAQAAQHVRLVTAAIASERFKDTEGTVWLRAHDKSGNQALTNHLLNNQLDDPGLEPFLKSITAVPAVHPSVAHVLATRYRSLGGLMDALLDPTRSDAAKEKEIAGEMRVGTATARRVGPAAARNLLQLLRCDDPNLRVKRDGKEEA